VLRFHATSVECFSQFAEVLTVSFDNRADHYLALQVWTEGFEENADGIGMIHVEVDDQSNSGYDCFTEVELRRNAFHICFDGQVRELAQLRAVEVTFALGADEFKELGTALRRIFR
jgi:hypothetical protein